MTPPSEEFDPPIGTASTFVEVVQAYREGLNESKPRPAVGMSQEQLTDELSNMEESPRDAALDLLDQLGELTSGVEHDTVTETRLSALQTIDGLRRIWVDLEMLADTEDLPSPVRQKLRSVQSTSLLLGRWTTKFLEELEKEYNLRDDG